LNTKHLAKFDACKQVNFNELSDFYIPIESEQVPEMYERFPETLVDLTPDEKLQLEVYMVCENLELEKFLKEIQIQVQKSPIFLGKYRLRFEEQITVTMENYLSVFDFRKYNKSYFYIFCDNHQILKQNEYEILLKKADSIVFLSFF